MDDPDPAIESLEQKETSWQKVAIRECEEESRQANPVAQWMRGVKFTSRSKGKGRSRRNPIHVVLLSVNGDHFRKRWRLLPKEDRNSRSVRMDDLATEIFGPGICERLSVKGIHPDDHLRNEIHRLLAAGKGRF